MGLTIDIVENNKDKILGELDEAIDRALEAIGIQVENYAKVACPVDTGLLRNSITHARGGQPAAIKSYHAGDKNGNMIKNGKKLKTVPKNAKQTIGFYTGTAPNEEHTVFVGSNVEYAPYVEFGHKLPSGGTVPGEHFLERAITGHKKQLEKLAETALKGF